MEPNPHCAVGRVVSVHCVRLGWCSLRAKDDQTYSGLLSTHDKLSAKAHSNLSGETLDLVEQWHGRISVFLSTKDYTVLSFLSYTSSLYLLFPMATSLLKWLDTHLFLVVVFMHSVQTATPVRKDAVMLLGSKMLFLVLSFCLYGSLESSINTVTFFDILVSYLALYYELICEV